jgi:hypothetical protein
MKRGGSCIESIGVGKIATLKAKAYVEKNCPKFMRKYSSEMIHNEKGREEFVKELGNMSNYMFMPYTDLIGVEHFNMLATAMWDKPTIRLKAPGIFMVYNHEWEMGKMIMPKIDANGKRKKGAKQLFVIKIR